ncbi:MAG: glutamate dehydrogenase [Mangrovimonas sp.]|nr:glutamate dehydrogenase [Mangrovimonas sp.]MCB0434646.1 glutamate dehydrogenase [Mangrovimonas sp.]MCB0437855.1 glutamate dehydrogenase [Mangrovimonas sp.]HRV55537.1 glutamate dehydrogenase [Mangrovimonas sp.]
MLNLKKFALLLCCLLSFYISNAQLGFSHEIGAIVGPVQFRSDYGERFDESTNFGNTGIGIGLIHYINFSYRADCNCYTTDNYFNDHFKLRSELSYNYTKLEHYGEWANSSGPEYDKLRAQHGVAKNFDIGMQLEYFPLSIRSFQAFSYRFAPFISLGAHWTNSSPEATTDYGSGNVYDYQTIFAPWVNNPDVNNDYYPISEDSHSAWSMVTSIGVRYKLTKLSDLMLDLRWQFYFDDWIDGLNHNLNSNKFNDNLIWLNFGYIYYLD